MNEGEIKSRTGVVSIYKSFEECVKEIIDLESKLKIIPPAQPREEFGQPVKFLSGNYKETLAELRRLMIVKRMCEKRGIK